MNNFGYDRKRTTLLIAMAYVYSILYPQYLLLQQLRWTGQLGALSTWAKASLQVNRANTLPCPLQT